MVLIVAFLAIALPILAGVFLSPAEIHRSALRSPHHNPARVRMRWMHGSPQLREWQHTGNIQQ
jgi:hypothetical protein